MGLCEVRGPLCCGACSGLRQKRWVAEFSTTYVGFRNTLSVEMLPDPGLDTCHQHLDVDTAVYSVHSVPWTGIVRLGLRLDGDHAVDLECDVISHREKRDTDETDQARLAFGLQLAETKRGIGDTKVRVGSDAKLKLDASQRNHRIAVKIPSRSARGLLPCPSRRGVAVCAK